MQPDGTIGQMALVPPDWGDGGDTDIPYNTPSGVRGCVPLQNNPVEETPTMTGENLVPEIITLTTEDFETFPITPATPHQERVPHTLKNYNTNFYTTPNPQEFTRTINNQTVTLKATPASYTYTYGDGTTLGPTSHPGYPLGEDIWDQETPTSHQYTETGNYHYTLTTAYRGEYSVNGGPWQVIDGTVSRTSDPQLVRVWRTEVRLVDGSCAEEPTAWGCPESTATPTPTW